MTASARDALVDTRSDEVVDSAGGGYDTVLAIATFTLRAEVEALTLSASGVIKATADRSATCCRKMAQRHAGWWGSADPIVGSLGNDVYHADNWGEPQGRRANHVLGSGMAAKTRSLWGSRGGEGLLAV